MMLQEKGIRLGPLMLLLLLVAVSMSCLAVLTFSSARADMILAQRYGNNVYERYQLDKEGCEFLIEDTQKDVQKELNSQHYQLKIIKETGTLHRYALQRIWENDETIKDLWKGN